MIGCTPHIPQHFNLSLLFFCPFSFFSLPVFEISREAAVDWDDYVFVLYCIVLYCVVLYLGRDGSIDGRVGAWYREGGRGKNEGGKG